MASPTHPDHQFTEAWRAWIAENILLGSNPRELIRAMVDQGFSPELSEAEVQAALTSPYVAAAARLGVGASEAPTRPGRSARAAKYEWWMEVQRRTAKLASTHGRVPRIGMPSNDAFLDDFYAANRPCVIEGAIADWPALAKWTPDYLKATCGDAVVEVESNRTRADGVSLSSDRTMPFGDFVDIVESNSSTDRWYMTAQNDRANGVALAPLWNDVRLPAFLTQDAGPIGGAFVWYGPAGTLSPAHHDLTNNLMAQVIGRKRVRLVAPNESAHLQNDHGRRSLADFEQPDLVGHPELADVTFMEVVIGPGDLLFIPAGWWHCVRALDASFTFTFTNFVYDANDYYAFYTSDRDLTEG